MRRQKAEGRRQKGGALGDARASSFCLLPSAFTLLEVMIAMGIFFMAVFSILALVSNGLRNAAALQEMPVDASMLAAELAVTNRLEEGFDSGDFRDIFPNYRWIREVTEVGSNGLFQVDFAVIHDVRGRPAETHMSILLYRPESQRRR